MALTLPIGAVLPNATTVMLLAPLLPPMTAEVGVDWATLIFFMSIFVLIGGLEKTGIIGQLSQLLGVIIGQNIFFGSLLLLFTIGILSSVIPNVPLVVAMVPLLKKYLVEVGRWG